MRVLSPSQIKAWDSYTIQHQSIAAIDLMERACEAFTNWFVQRFPTSKKILIVCGTGNNGGDGLGIARLLCKNRYPVSVWIVNGAAQTAAFKLNHDRLPKDIAVTHVADWKSIPETTSFSILIDALFGIGLSRPPAGIYAEIIRVLNDTNTTRIAVDIPSGLPAESTPTGVVLKAHHTLTFQLPKLAFFLPQSYQYVGDWFILYIGLDKPFGETLPTHYFFTEAEDAQSLIKPRTKFDHKGTHGKALLIAGSYGKMGAAVLAAKAAMRAGLGLLTVHIPKAGYEIIQNSVPEAMVSVDNDLTHFSTCPDLEMFDAIGIGPGLGLHPDTQNAFGEVLQQAKKPLVVDADALNIIAHSPELIQSIPKNSILTPHPGEFARLVGTWKNDFERLQKQKTLSVDRHIFVVLKGAHTSISTPDGNIYFNSTGNPGMSTGGSGDVLTGILTSLLAQGYSSLNSALLGVFLHGLAGDLAASEVGQHSLIASDIIEKLPKAYHFLENL